MADGSVDKLTGTRVPRPNARRLATGHGRYTDDLSFTGLLHVAYVRSPYAHARIVGVDSGDAMKVPGVRRVITGAELAEVCAPWDGGAAHMPSMIAATQHALAVDIARWQGEPVAAVAAESRAAAEDGAERVVVEFDPLPAIADPDAALESDAPLVHPDIGSNQAFEANIPLGEDGSAARTAMAEAAHVLSDRFVFSRHTAVPLEPRAIVAEYNPGDDTLTVHQNHQSPWQQRDVYARQLGLAEHNVRVIAPDVGGAFGIKLHVYGDEVATAAIAKLMKRPVKYVADRMESFLQDMHAREQRVEAKLGVDAEGGIVAMETEAVLGLGAFLSHRRNSVMEGMMTVTLSGAPYNFDAYRGRLRAAYQNKTPLGVYRAVGQPIACAVTEQLLDDAAAATGVDPVEIRRRNYLTDADTPRVTPGGIHIEGLSLTECLDGVVDLMDYDALRREQATLREQGIYRGIGLATFLEMTAVGSQFYGPAKVRVSTQDGATVRLEASGAITCLTSATDQGQGTWTGIGQIVADRLGVGMQDVRILSSDTGTTPYGGGAWASRGLTIAGEAAALAANALRDSILDLAATILQTTPDALDLRDGGVVERETGTRRLGLDEVADIGLFQQDTLPPDFQPELSVTRSYAPRTRPYAIANGIQASWLEVDIHTGTVRLLDHWVVEDCGRVINPQLVDEQIRGGVVQGLGGALFEQCLYDSEGQMLNATLADYLVPMASEMPDIHIGHVETPFTDTELGTKGAGEAGAVGAAAAVMVAVNDALRPLGARVMSIPIGPETILQALAEAGEAH